MLLEARDVRIELGKAAVVDGVSLQLRPGELLGLIGPNGAGKSTLLAALAGVQALQSGDIALRGRALSGWSAEERARTLGWIEQAGSINWPLSVEELVALGRLPHRRGWRGVSADDRDAIEAAMRATDSLAFRARPATELSVGERARVLIARALAGEPQLLLADEPVAALDLAHQLQVMALLRHFASGERGAIVVLHDLALAMRYCDRLCLLDRGRLVATGAPKDVVTEAHLRAVYRVDAAIGDGPTPWVIPRQQVDTPEPGSS